MKIAKVNGIELEYQVTGSGEPLLLISPVLADGFVPLVAERLLERYTVIAYHKRGWVGSTRQPGPVSVADHAADANALLDHLGIARAHVAGHSSGAAVAVQLALDYPGKVHSLILLELSLLTVPSAEAFLAKAGPAFEAFAAGNREQALEIFMTAASGLPWDECRALLEDRVPGSLAQSLKDADTFFGVELPALTQWSFTAAQAARVKQPTLSILGTKTEPLWVDVDALLRSSMPNIVTTKIDDVGHLLHIQAAAPVAQAFAAFTDRNPMRA
ncbi:MAG: alpha/beta hydrolase [Myxococcota bacterium]|nr:alpha/beta hydrolase [Deltaproteobacteria bacterium]MDQ3337188.1 alpha/beta hydrolase [Myxococcota bacterium]